jgi:acetoin utilization deacetylase AcuC-like enzyme
MTEAVLEAARQHCEERLVSVLEGGYNLDALADCVTTHVSLLAAGA